jgi:predicted esterase
MNILRSFPPLRFACALALSALFPLVGTGQTAAERPWNDEVEARLALAGTNRAAIAKALREAPAAQRPGMIFLLENMPLSDLRSLTADFLLENLNLAYEGWEKSPWHDSVTEEMFFNDVLPYVCLSEKREQWRAKLREVCLPMISSCKTPGEAAHILNQKVFPYFNVRYNTGRRRPDQSPSESIQSGKATCTGLSILLVDACRSVGIPARVAGTAMWTNMRGNHTWVEVWDRDWHFMGAAEPDAAGLDHGWFVADASKAQRDAPQHAIYATSFRHTDVSFPLVWHPGDKTVSAVNVTDCYAKPKAPGENVVRLAVRVVEADSKRAVAEVVVTDLTNSASSWRDKSRGETADLNDFASFKLVPSGRYRVVARLDGREAQVEVAAQESGDQQVTLTLPEKSSVPSAPNGAVPQPVKSLPTKDAARLKMELDKYFAADADKKAKWKFPSRLEKLLRQKEPAVRQVAWEAYRCAPFHTSLKADFDTNLVRFEQYISPYTVKRVGERPAKGWPLFIAMHGGGGAPKQVNDNQWKQMQRYYKDHPEVGGYLYLALRAPNDTWNGFYDNYVYPLIDNLILQFRLFGDIDPDKVFIMGYSHGGYGAYAIGPKMPDRFAAIHASAAAATDAETTGKTLRATPFTAMVGELDTMYGRYERNLKFKEQIEQLRGGRTDIYPVTITIVKGNGHGGLPDRDKIKDMYPAVRNPVPRELTWLMTDGVVRDFFWLHVAQPGKQQEILASCQNNRFVITANADVTTATVLMDTRLVDYTKPVEIELNGSTVKRRFAPSLKMMCETLARRGDPAYAFSAGFTIAKDSNGHLVVQPAAK